MPAPTDILQLIAQRDAAHLAYVEARNSVGSTYSAFLAAQDELAEAILATGTDTFIDEHGNEHKARRGGMATVHTTKANTNG